MWRDMIAQIKSGIGHDMREEVQPGELAIFCPACPQPGINLSKEWDKDPKRYICTPISKPLLISYSSGGYIQEAL